MLGSHTEFILLGPSGAWRQRLARIMSRAGLHIIGSATHFGELDLSSLPPRHSAFVVVAAGNDHAAAIKQVRLSRRQWPTARIAVVTNKCPPAAIILAFRAGANGYCINIPSSRVLIKFLELVSLEEATSPSLWPCILASSRIDGKHEPPEFDADETERSEKLPRLSQRNNNND